jgi:hypothetical protein
MSEGEPSRIARPLRYSALLLRAVSCRVAKETFGKKGVIRS